MEDNKLYYPDSNRVGKFQIMHEVLRDGGGRPMLQALFGLCVVLECVEHESGRGKAYTAAGGLFQPLAEGEEIPEYRIECAWPGQPFKNPADEAGCLQAAGGFRFKAIRKNIVRVPLLTTGFTPRGIAKFH